MSGANTPRYIEVEGHDLGDVVQQEGPQGGAQGSSGGGFLFSGPSEEPEGNAQQLSHAGAAQDAGGAKDSLYLHEDQEAENPLASQQPISAAAEPSVEQPKGQEGPPASPGAPSPGLQESSSPRARRGPPPLPGPPPQACRSSSGDRRASLPLLQQQQQQQALR
ncbi:LOW QUALITY PROTEIN: uncharacterized protein EMH_0091680 [Eimeria mitis]|uniref:Uncharacterized protein n=1 Tax=Eimeria mitis TaxID=44415 RepID=U6JSA6_9EIME|nr:LOW QUALITY PROTEIN: uncharacterized protein EMH_0091680 [Eimeria mitis]CDJ27711.1 hypothetical protein EMH_0091680 [Eimeria mitis]